MITSLIVIGILLAFILSTEYAYSCGVRDTESRWSDAVARKDDSDVCHSAYRC